eukprot:6455389-Amphidinium_carterae.1
MPGYDTATDDRVQLRPDYYCPCPSLALKCAQCRGTAMAISRGRLTMRSMHNSRQLINLSVKWPHRD